MNGKSATHTTEKFATGSDENGKKKNMTIERDGDSTEEAGPSNRRPAGPVPARLKVGQFLLRILMLSHFARYIRWTGQDLEFQILNGQVVFTVWRMYKQLREDLTTNEDPKVRWGNELITSNDVKNNLKGIKSFKIKGVSLIRKIDGMTYGYYFTDREYVRNFLSIPFDQLLAHIANVTQGQAYPEVRCYPPSNNRTGQTDATFQLIPNPYACVITSKPIPPIPNPVEPSNSTDQLAQAPARPVFHVNYYPNPGLPTLYPSSFAHSYAPNNDPNEPSTSQNWPRPNEHQPTSLVLFGMEDQGNTSPSYMDSASVDQIVSDFRVNGPAGPQPLDSCTTQEIPCENEDFTDELTEEDVIALGIQIVEEQGRQPPDPENDGTLLPLTPMVSTKFPVPAQNLSKR